MQPYKKQLLRRNAWYRQQLQMQPTTQSARQNHNVPPATLTGNATTQATSGKL